MCSRGNTPLCIIKHAVVSICSLTPYTSTHVFSGNLSLFANLSPERRRNIAKTVLEPKKGIEPSPSAWKAEILTVILLRQILIKPSGCQCCTSCNYQNIRSSADQPYCLSFKWRMGRHLKLLTLYKKERRRKIKKERR